MDTSRVSSGEAIAAVGGLVLFVVLFFDWFGPFSAWETFDVVDIVLAAIGLGVAAVAAAQAAGTRVQLPGGPGVAVALAGFAATMITLTFLLEGEERKIGVWLAVLASLAITYGGWVAARGRPAAAPRSTPPPAPAGAPPPTA